MEEYNENAVVVDKCIWEKMKNRLNFLEKNYKSIKIEILCENINGYYEELKQINIQNKDKISPECMNEFNYRINELIESYKNYKNSYIVKIDENLQKDSNELKQIKKSFWYKLFFKNSK